MGDFLQVRIGLQQAFAVAAQRKPGGGLRTRQRRCHRAGDLQRLQTRAEGGGLAFADRRQRDIDLALVTAFGVPRRLAVTGKQDAHARGIPWGRGRLAAAKRERMITPPAAVPAARVSACRVPATAAVPERLPA
ncbi:hypothetical protein XPN_1884 [Xanthomonas arboricola pv. pruni MAFF 301427]|nr:hypothetical protein XPN_1884 [Xanthomonas arboricola pv. pruni MAFF 301427]